MFVLEFSLQTVVEFLVQDFALFRPFSIQMFDLFSKEFFLVANVEIHLSQFLIAIVDNGFNVGVSVELLSQIVVLFLCGLRELLKDSQSLIESSSFLCQLVILVHDFSVMLNGLLAAGQLSC